MKNRLFILIYLYTVAINSAFADNILWIDDEKLKQGDVTFSDIPKAIQSIISFILGFAATIAMIMIIVWALKYSLWSVEWNSPNKTKAMDTIKYGIMWFIIAISSWFIINLIVNNI